MTSSTTSEEKQGGGGGADAILRSSVPVLSHDPDDESQNKAPKCLLSSKNRDSSSLATENTSVGKKTAVPPLLEIQPRAKKEMVENRVFPGLWRILLSPPVLTPS